MFISLYPFSFISENSASDLPIGGLKGEASLGVNKMTVQQFLWLLFGG